MRKARPAAVVAARDTIAVPRVRPNRNPPAMVRAAPGTKSNTATT